MTKIQMTKTASFAKSQEPFSVIPTKAGIQENKPFWTPASAGVTTATAFREAVILNLVFLPTQAGEFRSSNFDIRNFLL